MTPNKHQLAGDPMPFWLVMVLLILLLCLYGIVGNMDYEDARMQECASKGLRWEESNDACIKP